MFTVLGKDDCSNCAELLALLEKMGFPYEVKKLDVDFDREYIRETYPTFHAFPVITDETNKVYTYSQWKQHYVFGDGED